MSKISLKGKGNINLMTAQIVSRMEDRIKFCRLAGMVEKQNGEITVKMLVFDKFYFRILGCMSVSVLLICDGENITVDAIVSGGRPGIVFYYLFGADKNFENLTREVLISTGLHY